MSTRPSALTIACRSAAQREREEKDECGLELSSSPLGDSEGVKRGLIFLSTAILETVQSIWPGGERHSGDIIQ